MSNLLATYYVAADDFADDYGKKACWSQYICAGTVMSSHEKAAFMYGWTLTVMPESGILPIYFFT